MELPFKKGASVPKVWALFWLLVLVLLWGCGSDLHREGGGPLGAWLTPEQGPVIDFGTVEVNSDHSKIVTLSNSGGQSATLMTGSFYLSVNFSFSGGTYPGVGGNCTDSLAPETSCTIEIRFTPKYEGELSDLLPISYFDGNKTVRTDGVKIKGKAIPPLGN